MTARNIDGKWWVDLYWTHLHGPKKGERERIRERAPINSKQGAVQHEQALRKKLWEGTEATEEHVVVPTLSEFSLEYLGTYVTANNKISEQDAKRSIIDQHLVPALGHLRLDQIGAREIETLRAALRTKQEPLGAKRINNVIGCLMSLLEYAYRVDLIAKPTRVKPLKVHTQKFDFLDFDEYARLLAAARKDPQTYAMVLVAGDAGLRLGEVMALGWSNIDLTARRVTVTQSSWFRKKVEHVGPPKSGRDRRVDASQRLIDALKAVRHMRGDRIFFRRDGTHMTPKVMGTTLHEVCRRAGIRPIAWHTLRHTFASHLAMSGADIKTIQEYMGHSTVAMTLKYMHLAPGHKRQAIDRLEQTRNTPRGQSVGSEHADIAESA